MGELNKYRSFIDVKGFIKKNYTEYIGDASFLKGPTKRTKELLKKVDSLLKLEMKNNGVLGIDTEKLITITSHQVGYIDKENELIVGLQTEEPLVRGINTFGGMRMARNACSEFGCQISSKIEKEMKYYTTHNDGVFQLYTDEMLKARKVGLLTGLPDAYGRGRIIGDYRRVPLYGVDFLIDDKIKVKEYYGSLGMTEENMRTLKEIALQIKALVELKEMALMYGFNIGRPAKNAKEAIQWLYFGYLAAIKQQNGAAMSLGRISTFLDIYIERDIREGFLTEETAQELIDDFVLKLRLARHLRPNSYNEIFAGDPLWITEAIGGMCEDNKKSLVTKTSFRILNTLYNLKSSAEPNLTVLWAENLPKGFKEFCAKVSIDTAAIQYENDDLMRLDFGDDYGIACCVSAMKIGKEMQFFGARANLAKMLLLALNGGIDNLTDVHLGPQMSIYEEEILDFDKVMKRLDIYRDWLSRLYVNTMNIIHYSHDINCYESLQMGLHDIDVLRDMSFGAAGLSVLGDSLSSIKYGKVKTIRNDKGLIVDFEIDESYPKYGNDDNRVDNIIVSEVHKFIESLRKNKTYRNAKHTLSILTITSNVMYGKKTLSTPDGRKAYMPFAPGANPMHNREQNGLLAALNSVSKISYDDCKDGISNTISIVPNTLGETEEERVSNLITVLDGYFKSNGHHLNVNVLNKELLMRAYENPEEYPNLTIRVSGYAVNFYKLSKEHQQEVIQRTFHEVL